MKGVKAQLNATNLFNRYYVASCFTACRIAASAMRALCFRTLKYNWQ